MPKAKASAIARPTAAQIMSINGLASKHGSVAQRLMTSGEGLQSLRTNALLRKDEWIEFDTRVLDITRQRLVGFEDLRTAGLVRPLSSIGVLISQYETASDMTGADVDMNGLSAGRKDSIEYVLKNVPVPVVHKDFEINIRRLEASRRLGDAISTTQATTAGRRVADKIEDILFNGLAGTLEGQPLYGYTNHPNVNTGTARGDWGTSTNIFDTVNDMVLSLEGDFHYGPYALYTHTNQFGQMRSIVSNTNGQSAWSLVRNNIPQITSIKPCQSLTDGQLVLVELQEDVVDFVVAEEVTIVQWDEKGGMLEQFKVMFVGAPRVKADANGRMGIAFYTGS